MSNKNFGVRLQWTSANARHALATSTYLLGLFDDFRALGLIDRTALACRVFGRDRIQAQIKQVIDVIRSWGYSRFMGKDVQWALCTVLLANKSPNLHDLSTEILKAERDVATVYYRAASITILSSALKHLGVIQQALDRRYGYTGIEDARNGVDPVWVEWVERLVSDFHDSTKQSRATSLFAAQGGAMADSNPPGLHRARPLDATAGSGVGGGCLPNDPR